MRSVIILATRTHPTRTNSYSHQPQDTNDIMLWYSSMLWVLPLRQRFWTFEWTRIPYSHLQLWISHTQCRIGAEQTMRLCQVPPFRELTLATRRRHYVWTQWDKKRQKATYIQHVSKLSFLFLQPNRHRESNQDTKACQASHFPTMLQRPTATYLQSNFIFYIYIPTPTNLFIIPTKNNLNRPRKFLHRPEFNLSISDQKFTDHGKFCGTFLNFIKICILSIITH